MDVYTVTMFRWGNKERHSYLIGAFTKFEKAVKAGNDEVDWRGGKYEAVVQKIEVDKNYNCSMKPLPEIVHETY